MSNLVLEVNEVFIKDFEGQYSINSDGEVFSHNYRRTGKKHIMRTCLNNYGYRIITLSDKGEKRTFLVSFLVALNFMENPKGLQYLFHKDGDKTNDSISNLALSKVRLTSEKVITVADTIDIGYLARIEEAERLERAEAEEFDRLEAEETF